MGRVRTRALDAQLSSSGAPIASGLYRSLSARSADSGQLRSTLDDLTIKHICWLIDAARFRHRIGRARGR